MRCVQGFEQAKGGLHAHSWCLMNEGCLWLLGEESGFNMSLERGPGRLYWSRAGRYVRDGIWQEETVGHRKSDDHGRQKSTNCLWVTQNSPFHVPVTTTHTLQMQAAVMTAISVCASAITQYSLCSTCVHYI